MCIWISIHKWLLDVITFLPRNHITAYRFWFLVELFFASQKCDKIEMKENFRSFFSLSLSPANESVFRESKRVEHSISCKPQKLKVLNRYCWSSFGAISSSCIVHCGASIRGVFSHTHPYHTTTLLPTTPKLISFKWQFNLVGTFGGTYLSVLQSANYKHIWLYSGKFLSLTRKI